MGIKLGARRTKAVIREDWDVRNPVVHAERMAAITTMVLPDGTTQRIPDALQIKLNVDMTGKARLEQTEKKGCRSSWTNGAEFNYTAADTGKEQILNMKLASASNGWAQSMPQVYYDVFKHTDAEKGRVGPCSSLWIEKAK